MKGKMLFPVLVLLFASMFGSAHAGTVGDINDDGSIDLSEAIYALQVAAGTYPSLSPSCLLVGKGDWAAGEDYNPCDVVQYGGSTYACADPHIRNRHNDPTNSTWWPPLTLIGPTGLPVRMV